MRISLVAAVMLLTLGLPYSLSAGEASQDELDESLHDTILALDEQLFAAFNACDLEGWKRFLAEDIEFYQDNDKVTTSRSELEPSFIDRCDGAGHASLQRELVVETVEVYPIQGYGAVQFGSHRFWVMLDNKRHQHASTPKFVHLWRNNGGDWQITRVISYGH